MGDYDKALMAFYTSIYSAKVTAGRQCAEASLAARQALADFKQQFPRPDSRKNQEAYQ